MRKLILIFFLIPILVLGQQDSIQELESVDVFSNNQLKLPTLENEYVLDYLFVEDDVILLSKIKHEYFIRIVDNKFNEIRRITLNQHPRRFYTDCMGYNHLFTKDSSYQMYISNHDIQFLYANDKDEFLKLISGCVGTTERGLVYETFMHKNQTHMFIEFDTINDRNNLLYVKRDMKNYYSIYEDQKRHERDLAAGINNLSAMSLYFNHVVLSKEGYLPFFNLDTGYLILNHKENIAIKGSVYRAQSVFDIAYHHQDSWTNHIIQSQEGDIFYAKLIDGGLVLIQDLGRELTADGKMTKVNKHTFPEQLKVKDGYLYYLAKESKESSYIKFWKLKL